MDTFTLLSKCGVYPNFTKVGVHKQILAANIMLIENDEGQICWISQQEKDKFLESYPSKKFMHH